MTDNKVAKILNGVAAVMRAEFEKTANIVHRGEKGTAREISVVHDFLAQYLPGNVRVTHSGEIITSTGETSPQCDVIVYDPATPPMLDAGSYMIIPNECAYGVVEVKSMLDGNQLRDACEKIAAVKRLSKAAFMPDHLPRSRTVYGKTYNYVPTVGVIFAYDSIDLEVLKRHLTEWSTDRPAEELPESVWVLGKGYLQWLNPMNGKVDPAPEPGATIGIFEPPEVGDVLFPLMFHLNLNFATAWMPPINLLSYAGDAPLGTFRDG